MTTLHHVPLSCRHRLWRMLTWFSCLTMTSIAAAQEESCSSFADYYAQNTAFFWGFIGLIGLLVGLIFILAFNMVRRHRAENALTSVFRVAPIGIGLVADREIRQVNDQVCDMLGYSREELVGRTPV